MPAVALSRVGARGRVRSRRRGSYRGDVAATGGAAWPALAAGADLPAGLPDRYRGLRVHRCGNDRFTAVGQWIGRAGHADLARLRAPWDPIAGRYWAPDEKTIRVVLDRLDPRSLAGALLGPRPRGRQRTIGEIAACDNEISGQVGITSATPSGAVSSVASEAFPWAAPGHERQGGQGGRPGDQSLAP